MKRNQRRWIIWVGFVISAIFLFFTFREINYKELWDTLRKTRAIWLIPGLGVYFLGVLVRTWRWQYLLKPLKKVSIKTLFPIINIGYMGNNVFPLRMGEVLRAVVLKRREDVAISGSLATIVVERIFDAVVIVGFVLLNLSQLSTLSENILFSQLGSIATWAVIIFLAGLTFFILIAMFPKSAQGFIQKIILRIFPERWRTSLINIADRFLEGLMSLRSPRDTVMIFLTSILIWMLETGLYWSVAQSLTMQVTFGQLMLLNGVVNLVLLIPAAPGGLGTFDAAGRVTLESFNIPSELALGYTLVLRIALWVPITILGTIYFVREGLKWTSDVGEMQAQAKINDTGYRKG
ncbi:MAG: lysylphosphatidylglycerol synthase transmembrane domain-containing protein, partial [Anaerolineales bacterium]